MQPLNNSQDTELLAARETLLRFAIRRVEGREWLSTASSPGARGQGEHHRLNEEKARVDVPPTIALTNELLVLPASVCDELQQLYRLPFVLFFQVVQPQYFQENQDTPDLQKFDKVSVSARTGEQSQKRHLPWSPPSSFSTPCCWEPSPPVSLRWAPVPGQ